MFGFIKKYGWSGLVILAIGYLSLSDAPVEEPLFTFPYLDKVVHFCMYGGLVFVLGIDICRSGKESARLVRSFGAAWIFAVVLGGCMELFQGAFTETRMADWLDFLANTAGATVGYLVVRFILRPFWFRYFHAKNRE